MARKDVVSPIAIKLPLMTDIIMAVLDIYCSAIVTTNGGFAPEGGSVIKNPICVLTTTASNPPFCDDGAPLTSTLKFCKPRVVGCHISVLPLAVKPGDNGLIVGVLSKKPRGIFNMPTVAEAPTSTVPSAD